MDSRVQTVLVLMESGLNKKLSLDRMAESAYLSRWHLLRLFKAETGVTPAKYLKHLRMQRASYLLKTSFLSVKEIMVKLGIGDKSHFTSDFKLFYGTSPIRYRFAEYNTKVEPLTETAKSANK